MILNSDLQELKKAKIRAASIHDEIETQKSDLNSIYFDNLSDPKSARYKIKYEVWVNQRLDNLRNNLATARAIEHERENQASNSMSRLELLKKIEEKP